MFKNIILDNELKELLYERKTQKDVSVLIDTYGGYSYYNIYNILRILLFNRKLDTDYSEEYDVIIREIEAALDKYNINNIYINTIQNNKNKILCYKNNYCSVYIENGILKNIYLFIDKDIIYNPDKEQIDNSKITSSVEEDNYEFFVDMDKKQYYYINKCNEKVYMDINDFKCHIIYNKFKDKLMHKIFEDKFTSINAYELTKTFGEMQYFYKEKIKEMVYKCFFAIKDHPNFDIENINVNLLSFDNLIEKYNTLINLSDDNTLLSPNKSYLLLDKKYKNLNTCIIYVYKAESVSKFNLDKYKEYMEIKNNGGDNNEV